MALANQKINKVRGEKPSTGSFDYAVEFDGDSSYTTGGTVGFTAIIKALLKKAAIEVLHVTPNYCGIYVPVYNIVNDTLMVFVRTTGLEVGAGVDMSGTKFYLTVSAK